MCSNPQSRPFCAQVHFNLLCCWMGLPYVSSHVIFNRRFLLMMRGSKCSINSLNDRSWCSPQCCSAGLMGKERMALTGADVLVGFDGLPSPKAFLASEPLASGGASHDTSVCCYLQDNSASYAKKLVAPFPPDSHAPSCPSLSICVVSLCFHFFYIICCSLNVSHTQRLLSGFLVSSCAPG